jgi:hypothetical protein
VALAFASRRLPRQPLDTQQLFLCERLLVSGHQFSKRGSDPVAAVEP